MRQSHFEQLSLVLRASPGSQFHAHLLLGSLPDCRICLRHSTCLPGCEFTLQLPAPYALCAEATELPPDLGVSALSSREQGRGLIGKRA